MTHVLPFRQQQHQQHPHEEDDYCSKQQQQQLDENKELESVATRWRVCTNQPVNNTARQKLLLSKQYKNTTPSLFQAAPSIPFHQAAAPFPVVQTRTPKAAVPFQVIHPKAALVPPAKKTKDPFEKSTKRLRKSSSRKKLRKSKRPNGSLHSNLSTYFSTNMMSVAEDEDGDSCPYGSSTSFASSNATEALLLQQQQQPQQCPPHDTNTTTEYINFPTMWWELPYISAATTPDFNHWNNNVSSSMRMCHSWGQFVDIELSIPTRPTTTNVDL